MALPRTPQRTTPGFAFSIIERSLKDCLGRRKFGQTEKQHALEFFGLSMESPKCVFCGSSDVKRWDHLVPVSLGGETVLGNMVPACTQCDDAMRELPFDEWMMSDDRYSPKSLGIKGVNQRIHRIREYTRHFNYVPSSLEERLNEDELEKLSIIHEKLCKIRSEIEALIIDYLAKRDGDLQ